MLLFVIYTSVIAVQLMIYGKSKALTATLKALSQIMDLMKDGGWQLIIIILLAGLFWGKNK